MKKAHKAKRLKRGVREVVKGLRKDEKGVVILAENISHIDFIFCISDFGAVRERSAIYLYWFVLSWKDLGGAGGARRPVLCSFNPVSSTKSCMRTAIDALS